MDPHIYVVVGVGKKFHGPTVYYDTMEEAENEADRLAMKYPGENFIVCKVVKNKCVKGVQNVFPGEGMRHIDDKWV